MQDTVISSGRKRSYEAALETHILETADLFQEACQRPRIWQQHPQYTQDTDMDEPFADSTPAVKKRCNKPLCTMMMRTGNYWVCAGVQIINYSFLGTRTTINVIAVLAGTCVRGSRCVFQHPDPISLPAVRFNRWGLPLRPDEVSLSTSSNLPCCTCLLHQRPT